jgi:hypothetical protein
MSIVYIDEELPEIEITEYITGDQYIDDYNNLGSNKDIDSDRINKKTGYNIYKTDEIYNQIIFILQPLLSNLKISVKLKATVFQNLHKNIITPKKFNISTNIIPEVYIQRKDNSDEIKFFEEYDIARGNGKYSTRTEELRKAFLGFETTSIKDPIFKNNIRTTVYINGTNNEHAVILPNDTEFFGTVGELFIKKGISPFHPKFYLLSLVDKLVETESEPYDSVNIDSSLSLEINIENYLNKSVKNIIKNINKVGSIYDLWKNFIENGIDIDDISSENMEIIINKLQTLQKNDTEVFDNISSDSEYDAVPLKKLDEYSIYGFYVIQKKILDNLNPTLIQLKQQLINLFKTFINEKESSENISSTFPTSAYEISLQILENKITLVEVIKILKYRLIEEQQTIISEWYDLINAWDVPKTRESFSREFNISAKTLESINDNKTDIWKSINDEIKIIIKKEIISKEYNENETESLKSSDKSINEFDSESSNFQESEDISIYDTEVSIDISNLYTGVREIYMIVLKLLKELERVSGLPIDYDFLTKSLPIITRITKFTQIKQAFPKLSEDIHIKLNDIHINDFESDELENHLEDLPPNIYKEVESKFKDIYKEFMKDIKSLLIFSIAWWICNIQDSVLNRRLLFQTQSGFLGCIHLWNPISYPMNISNKNKNKGVLPYINCIISYLQSIDGTTWNKLLKGMKDTEINTSIYNVFEKDLVENVTDIQNRFKTFVQDTPLSKIYTIGLDACYAVKNTLNAANKNKKHFLRDYMKFLINLPSVWVSNKDTQSIYVKLNLGCCLQEINENYKADSDWSNYVKIAYKLKLEYAKARIISKKKPFLMNTGKNFIEITKTYVKKNDLIINKPTDPVYDEWNIEEWIEQFKKHILEKNYNIIVNNTQDILQITEKHLTILTTSHVINKSIDNFITSEDISIQSLIESFRKLIQIQYLEIHTNHTKNRADYDFLLKEFKKLEELNNILLDNKYVNSEKDEITHKRILQFFIIKQLAFPANIEELSDKKKINITLNATSISKNMLGNYHRQVILQYTEWINTKIFNKSIDYTTYIAKEREKENRSKFGAIDVMNPEERSIYREAKKLGLSDFVELENYIKLFKEAAESKDTYVEGNRNEDNDGDEDNILNTGDNDDEADEDSFNDE